VGQGEFAITGTPEYMAPEQASAAVIDGRTDLYALASVLYELCTGRLPFVAGSAVALSELKGRSSPEPMRVRSRAFGIPASVDRVVMKALAPRAEDRYASATDFRKALERVFAVPDRRRAASHGIGYACIGAATLFAIGVLAKISSPVPSPTLSTHASIAATSIPTARPTPLPTTTATPVPTAIAMPSPAATPLPMPRATDVVARVPRAQQPTEKKLTEKKADPDAVARVLTIGTAALQSGMLADALVIHRNLAKQHSDDARVVRMWAESAAAAREWGEAIEASEAWALADAGLEPRLYLARMLAYSGRRRAAVRILENLIEAHPEADEARALLRDYRGDEPPKAPSSARAERGVGEGGGGL
jgi:hypothetical protein